MAKPNPTLPILTEQCIQRFWSYVDKSPGQGPEGECWEWARGRDGKNYGAFSVRGKILGTHRIAYLLSHGTIPEALSVCHTCDNPPCVRPDHLWIGTDGDNSRDMVRKGRSLTGDKNPMRTHPERVARGARSAARLHPENVRGENNGMAKLTTEDVLEIRRQRALGCTLARLVQSHKVSKATIHRIIAGRSWQHLL